MGVSASRAFVRFSMVMAGAGSWMFRNSQVTIASLGIDAAENDPSVIWEGHKAGRDIGYCHLEKLHNLESLPDHGFTICCFPVKIKGASAGWTRAVAIMN